MARLVSIYVTRPLIAVTVCVAAAMLVEDAGEGYAQIALATPTVAGLLLCAIDWERMAFAAAGFAGAAAFGLTVAGIEASETITGYDLTFLVTWTIISAFSGLPVYGIWYVWAAVGEVRRSIDELVEVQHDRISESPVPEASGTSDSVAGSGPGPVGTIAGALLPAALMTPPGGSLEAAAQPAPNGPPFEKPENFAAEELVASIERTG